MYHGPRGVPWPSRGVPWPLYEDHMLKPAIMIYWHGIGKEGREKEGMGKKVREGKESGKEGERKTLFRSFQIFFATPIGEGCYSVRISQPWICLTCVLPCL